MKKRQRIRAAQMQETQQKFDKDSWMAVSDYVQFSYMDKCCALHRMLCVITNNSESRIVNLFSTAMESLRKNEPFSVIDWLYNLLL